MPHPLPPTRPEDVTITATKLPAESRTGGPPPEAAAPASRRTHHQARTLHLAHRRPTLIHPTEMTHPNPRQRLPTVSQEAETGQDANDGITTEDWMASMAPLATTTSPALQPPPRPRTGQATGRRTPLGHGSGPQQTCRW